MSELAIAFPSEVAAAVAEAVWASIAHIAWPLLLLMLGLIAVLLCKSYAIRHASRSKWWLLQFMARH